jgi:hypothetical protein
VLIRSTLETVGKRTEKKEKKRKEEKRIIITLLLLLSDKKGEKARETQGEIRLLLNELSVRHR